MTGIICAMSVEIEILREKMKNKSVKTISGIEFIEGDLSGKKAVITRGGMGKVAAGVCAQTMIREFNVEKLINTGVAGTLTDKLSRGDIAVSESVVQHDVDTSAVGDPVGMVSGINKIYFPADKDMADKAIESIKEEKLEYLRGIIASGDQFIANENEKKRIVDNFSAIACEMEGGAIGQVAYINNVPFVVLRAISDGADDDVKLDYPAFVAVAAKNSARVTIRLIEKL